MVNIENIIKNFKNKNQNNQNLVVENKSIIFQENFKNKLQEILQDNLSFDDISLVLQQFFIKHYNLSTKIKMDEPIDMVYTYVDFTDKKHRDKLKKYSTKKLLKNKENFQNRYINFNEFYCNLKLFRLHVPWIRYIFIVTPTPHHIQEIFKDDNQIKIIFDEDILDKDVEKPSFKSTVFESYLHNIPELSNCFLYGCDDMTIVKPLSKEKLFLDGVPLINLESRKMYKKWKQNTNPSWVDVIQANTYFHKYFKIFPRVILNHQITFMRKDVCKITHDIYKNEILLNSTFMFRKPSTYNLHFILLHLLIGSSLGFFKIFLKEGLKNIPSSGYYEKNASIPWYRFYLMKNQKIFLFCINEINEKIFSYYIYTCLYLIEPSPPKKNICFVYDDFLKYNISEYEKLFEKYVSFSFKTCHIQNFTTNQKNTLFLVLCNENDFIKKNLFYLKINPKNIHFIVPDVLFFCDCNLDTSIDKIVNDNQCNIVEKYIDKTGDDYFYINFSKKQIQKCYQHFKIPLHTY